MPELKVTEEEREALVAMMRENFGTCICIRTPFGVTTCEGHRFLAETDGPGDLGRVDRMLFVRRTVGSRAWSEWTGRCPECQREGVVIIQSMNMCTRCADTLPIPHFDGGLKLPW